MREVLVSNLFKELLGPRTGDINEIFPFGKPVSEFQTGMLSPVEDEQLDVVRNNQVDNTIQPDVANGRSSLTTYQDSVSDDGDITSMVNPSLNPQKTPSTMGVSFQVECPSTPEFDVCLTWARYMPTVVAGENRFRRDPKYAILTASVDGDPVTFFDSTGKKCQEKKDAEVSFHLKSKTIENGNFVISMFFVNCLAVPDDISNAERQQYVIFQPQIRIVKKDNVALKQMRDMSYDPDHKKTELIYKNRPSYARGHMTSAIWKEIDPEIMDAATRKKFPEAVDALGFSWADRKRVPDADVTPFLTPDIRTEYIPMHSIRAPNQKWPHTMKPFPNAESFSQMWDPETLRKSLEAIPEEYSKWIGDLENAKGGTTPDKYIDDIILDCTKALERITKGIDLLVGDDDARLAFCFANKAINLQRRWNLQSQSKNVDDLDYRPFQIAFILMTIESVLHGNSKDRNICDLLWVPTGGGKTEAYLVLVAIDMAYRRLKSIRNGQSGAGVSVFTRYTLRLLSIQQFRRSLQIFAAAESLRVENTGTGSLTGWRPRSCTDTKDILWGSTPFSVGLWVGDNLTPNKLESYFDGMNKGALEALKLSPEIQKQRGISEPAQILNCPACNGILSIPNNGLAKNTSHELNLVIRSNSTTALLNNSLNQFTHPNITIDNNRTEFLELNPEYFVLKITFTSVDDTDWEQLSGFNGLWTKLERKLISESLVSEGCLQSTSAAKPGYFYKKYLTERGQKLKPYDFEIFCTSNSCPLNKKWFAGTPCGGINGNAVDMTNITKVSNDIKLTDGNSLVQVQKCFMTDDHVSDRIPIPALTVDDQVYKNLPTMIVATVDKFARLPFKPESSGLFGNAEYYNILHGYYRVTEVDDSGDVHKLRTGDTQTIIRAHRRLDQVEIPRPPNFIIQDELHLLEGPLGSMVGLYESSVDFLSETEHKIKYIASTATIKRGSDQVKSLFDRDLQVFPPNGVDVDDRFFISTKKSNEHILYDDEPGRLYLGVMAPSKGALTPIVRIWSSLAQTAKIHENNPEIDRFWTLVGYFNAVRELGGATALYRQDIKQRIKLIADHSGQESRQLDDRRKEELSGRTNSDDLPTILDKVGKRYDPARRNDAADSLFTTSMFGTGVDVGRLGLMLVNGQPKTTSAYIQSTGRVGREKGGLVVVFFRSTRPRDLSHYEYFMNHHVQLDRNVESPTVYPFANDAANQTLGPIMVGMIRNMRNPSREWQKNLSAIEMRNHWQAPEITQIAKFIETRSQNQPVNQIPDPQKIYNSVMEQRDKWMQLAQDRTVNELPYTKFNAKETPLILGDLLHESRGAAKVAFPNTPSSLRTLEGETGFGT